MKNIKLFEINRYDITNSRIVVVTKDFINKFIKAVNGDDDMEVWSDFSKVEKIGSNENYWGCDTDEISYLWTETDEPIDQKSQEYMDEELDLYSEE